MMSFTQRPRINWLLRTGRGMSPHRLYLQGLPSAVTRASHASVVPQQKISATAGDTPNQHDTAGNKKA
jgi:hypothetical protein